MIMSCSNSDLSPDSHDLTLQTSKLQINPIGALQELCMNNKWDLPKYYVSEIHDEQFIREFKVTCSVNEHESFGKGSKKKIAKNQAAYNMYKIIEKNLQTNQQIIQFNIGNYLKKYYEALNSQTHLENQDVLNDGSLKPIKFLERIAKMKNFKMKKFIIHETTDNSRIMLELKTNPIISCISKETTLKKAEESAALMVLAYLKEKN